MFRARTHLSAIVSALAVVGAAGPALAQDSWFRIVLGGGRDRGHQRDRVVIGRPKVERHPAPAHRPVYRPVEEAPCELQITAYQAGETVIVVASGFNRAAGFCTSLELCETRGGTRHVILHNTAPEHCGAAYRAAFEVTGSIQNCERVRCLTVTIGGHSREVAVTQVGRMS